MPANLSCDRCGTPYVPTNGDTTENATISIRRASDAAPGGNFVRFVCPTCEAMDEQIVAFAFPWSNYADLVLNPQQIAAAKAAVVASMTPPVTTTQAPAQPPSETTVAPQ